MEDVNIWYILLDLIITMICYMAIPTFVKDDNKIYTKKEAFRICFLNSIGVCIFFIILREILGDNPTKLNFTPALFYYYINKRYMLKNTSLKKDIKKEVS